MIGHLYVVTPEETAAALLAAAAALRQRARVEGGDPGEDGEDEPDEGPPPGEKNLAAPC